MGVNLGILVDERVGLTRSEVGRTHNAMTDLTGYPSNIFMFDPEAGLSATEGLLFQPPLGETKDGAFPFPFSALETTGQLQLFKGNPLTLPPPPPKKTRKTCSSFLRGRT